MTGKWINPLLVLLAMVLAAMLAGCSGSDSPDTISNATVAGPQAFLLAGDPVQFSARVATTDTDLRMLTFVGLSEIVVADDETEIVTVEQGVETPIPFDYIQVGDSVQVCGVLQENGDIGANRIRVFVESVCPEYDLSFRDVIASIDYDAGTFTVTERSETIATDAQTTIWGVDGGKVDFNSETVTNNANTSAKVVVDFTSMPSHVEYQFSDLEIGYIVEVKADIIDASNLMALSIKLAGANFKECSEFTAVIASLDCQTRTVTFEGFDWTGFVCLGAVLTGNDGITLDLCDFSVGDNVKIKGFATDEDNFKICLMEQI